MCSYTDNPVVSTSDKNIIKVLKCNPSQLYGGKHLTDGNGKLNSAPVISRLPQLDEYLSCIMHNCYEHIHMMLNKVPDFKNRLKPEYERICNILNIQKVDVILNSKVISNSYIAKWTVEALSNAMLSYGERLEFQRY